MAKLHLRDISEENKNALINFAESKNISLSKAVDIILSKVFISQEVIEREQIFLDHLDRNTNAFNEMTDVYRNNTIILKRLIENIELILK